MRLPSNHPQREAITKKFNQVKTGYSGELYVDRILNEIAFPRGTAILKDVTLDINPDFTIQIDTLILTTTSSLLLEIKNFIGTVHFDENLGKTVKIAPNGQVDKYDCAIHQLDRATTGLNEWLHSRGFQIPIEPILVMANNTTEIPEFPSSVALKYAKQLPRYIRNSITNESQLTSNQIQKIANIISRNNRTWYSENPCTRYKVSPNDLIRGVLCPDCNEPTVRLRGHSWYCRQCKKNTKHALRQSIEDWFLLVGPTINNRQIRLFLNLKSSSAASVILRKSNLKRQGNARNTIYMKP